MIIYEGTTTNFNNNGLGFITDATSATVVENLNGDMYLNVTVPLKSTMSDYLIEDNIIKANTGLSNYQLFRIKKITKTYKTITIYAPHIFYDLNDNFLLDIAPMNLTAQLFGSWILNKTNFSHNFTFYSDISGTASARYVRRNPVEAIIGDIDNSMVNIFGGDLERDNFQIKLLAYRGENTPKKLIFGKNIEDIKITIDTTNVYTRIIPIGYDGLLLPEYYVDSPRINEYRTPRITKVEFSDIKYDPDSEDESVYKTLEEAYSALRDAVNNLYDNGQDEPSINIKIDWLELSKTKEYYEKYSTLETMHLGDSVTAEIMGLNYSTRIIKTTYNVLSDTIDSFEVGTATNSIGGTITKTAEKIENFSVSSVLESAKNSATSQITQALGGYVYKTNNELYIMDTDNPNTAQKVWRWNINGLGYSSNGINGTYQTAMTQDGQIVADMITTGTISADRISGLNGLSVQVGKMGDYIHITDDGKLVIGNADAQFTLVQENDGIAIYSGDYTNPDNRISWWVQDQFTVTQLNLGNFAFIPRQNGSLGFRKVK